MTPHERTRLAKLLRQGFRGSQNRQPLSHPEALRKAEELMRKYPGLSGLEGVELCAEWLKTVVLGGFVFHPPFEFLYLLERPAILDAPAAEWNQEQRKKIAEYFLSIIRYAGHQQAKMPAAERWLQILRMRQTFRGKTTVSDIEMVAKFLVERRKGCRPGNGEPSKTLEAVVSRYFANDMLERRALVFLNGVALFKGERPSCLQKPAREWSASNWAEAIGYIGWNLEKSLNQDEFAATLFDRILKTARLYKYDIVEGEQITPLELAIGKPFTYGDLRKILDEHIANIQKTKVPTFHQAIAPFETHQFGDRTLSRKLAAEWERRQDVCGDGTGPKPETCPPDQVPLELSYPFAAFIGEPLTRGLYFSLNTKIRDEQLPEPVGAGAKDCFTPFLEELDVDWTPESGVPRKSQRLLNWTFDSLWSLERTRDGFYRRFSPFLKELVKSSSKKKSAAKSSTSKQRKYVERLKHPLKFFIEIWLAKSRIDPGPAGEDERLRMWAILDILDYANPIRVRKRVEEMFQRIDIQAEAATQEADSSELSKRPWSDIVLKGLWACLHQVFDKHADSLVLRTLRSTLSNPALIEQAWQIACVGTGVDPVAAKIQDVAKLLYAGELPAYLRAKEGPQAARYLLGELDPILRAVHLMQPGMHAEATWRCLISNFVALPERETLADLFLKDTAAIDPKASIQDIRLYLEIAAACGESKTLKKVNEIVSTFLPADRSELQLLLGLDFPANKSYPPARLEPERKKHVLECLEELRDRLKQKTSRNK